MSALQRFLLFWSRRLLLLNVVLLGMVCVLYGELVLRGHGRLYEERVVEFRLLGDLDFFRTEPGLENLLLPTLGAAFRWGWMTIGFEYTEATFVVFAAVPYALFIYGLTRYVARRAHGGRLLAMGTALALYTSGMIPYMTSWGGYVDGLSYLLLLPVLIWPRSLLVYAVTFILQCTNHYLGAVAQLLLAFVWHSLTALGKEDTAEDGVRYWCATFLPRAALSAVVLAAFILFWQLNYPEAAGARQAIVSQKWEDPEGVLNEVVSRFPWTLLSTLKLGLLPVVALMAATLPAQRARAAVLAVPFLAAAVLTFAFLDITRVATMVVMPALLVTILVAGRDDLAPPRVRRSLRRIVIATALLNLLIPNYYVNDGAIVVPESKTIRFMISTAVDLFD
jgi:hypothetical protein